MNPRIAVLPVDVANRIAAGEVIERPASAVKELLENAIDAGAGRITVEVMEAGRRLIRVTDDGEGMTPAEAGLALLRHATSKIRTDSDLFTIGTLGFRGEALPSMAAVSRMRLVTVAAGAPCGTEILVEGGSIKEERETAAAPGTMVEIADLFYNTPARRKFLKSPITEFGHICQVVQRLALGFPGIQFRLLHNRSSVVDYPAVRTARERIQQVYGVSLLDTAADVSGGTDCLRLEGICSQPLHTSHARHPQEILVNRRWVKCPAVAHAVSDAYGSYLAKGHYPQFVLMLSLDPRHVDINVHPTKREVRFSDQERLYDLIRLRVRAAIGSNGAIPEADRTPFKASSERSLPDFPLGQNDQAGDAFKGRATAGEGLTAEAMQSYLPMLGRELQVLGQMAARYLVAQIAGELQIVDQHTAHERVLFERLNAQLKQGRIISQRILLPQTLEFPADAAVLMRARLPDLEHLGFEVEEFGSSAFLVRAVPALLSQTKTDPADLLHALLEDWETELSTDTPNERYHAIMASLACHSAVRSGRRLEFQEISRLFEDWRDAGFPSTCPHGRRVAMRLTIEELDRIFGRAGWT
jgi:DNA mismatch repair protein MutL